MGILDFRMKKLEIEARKLIEFVLNDIGQITPKSMPHLFMDNMEINAEDAKMLEVLFMKAYDERRIPKEDEVY